jgi:succinate dehydrogenase/fumarate reductase cytochrome b subunit
MDQYQQPQINTGVPSYDYNPQQPVSPVITIKEWMLTTLVMIIPVVNVIMMFVWAFGEGNPTKKNYFKASLIWSAIILVIYVIIVIIFIAAAATSATSMN